MKKNETAAGKGSWVGAGARRVGGEVARDIFVSEKWFHFNFSVKQAGP